MKYKRINRNSLAQFMRTRGRMFFLSRPIIEVPSKDDPDILVRVALPVGRIYRKPKP
jgi:hypothetical protein